jgi:hypothetical protein
MALLAVLAAAPADAKKKGKASPLDVSVRTGTAVSTANGQVVSAVAVCPKGTIAIGGGFDAPRVVAGGGISDMLMLYESRRLGQHRWLSSAVRRDTGAAGPQLDLTTSVHCRSRHLPPKNGKKRILKVTEAVTSAATALGGGQTGVSALCRNRRTSVISGGFATSPQPDPTAAEFPLLFMSQRFSSGLWAFGMNNVGGTPRTLTGYAYCTKGKPPRQLNADAALPGTASFLNPGTATALSPACPKRRLAAGGFFNSGPPPQGSLGLLSQSIAAGRSWSLEAINLSPAPSGIAVLAYCL